MTEISSNKPFLLKAAYKDYLWGGSRLRDDYGQETELIPLAEAWVCSTYPGGESIAAGEKYQPLSGILKSHPEYIGTHPSELLKGEGRGDIPILVKLIDAKKALSVQVHPDDAYAGKYENGQLGKVELWYVLHAAKGAKLVYGFKHTVTSEIVRKAAVSGTLEKHLQYIPVEKDDVFVIEPGTVHAIGEGIVIAEIQESSNLTYRLYDYDRIDKYGNKRPLHIDKALDVLDMESSVPPRQPIRVLNYKNGYGKELLGRCKYFQVERVLLNTERYRGMANYKTGSNSFKVLLCIDGCGIILGDGVMIPFFKGDCIFVPADSIPLKLHGRAQILAIGA